MRLVRWAMVASLLEHRRNEEILDEAEVEQIAMEKEKLGWNGPGTSKEEIELNMSKQLQK